MFNQLNSLSTKQSKLQKEKKLDHTPKYANTAEQRLTNTGDLTK